MTSRGLSFKSLDPRLRGDYLARFARSLAALGVADQALLFRYLTLAQDVFLVLVRILAFLEHEAHRRADQLEALAEEVLEIAAIGLGEGLQAGAMDDERRRILGARMGEAQLGDVAAHHRRRVGLVGDLAATGAFRRAEPNERA